MAAYSTSIQIEELDSGASPLRVLELRGPGLPKQGANWGGESTVPTTWYPGNPDEATQQVLASKELPSKWEGTWRLTMLNRAPCRLQDASGLAGISPQSAEDVTSPGTLADILDDLRRKGRVLRVTWTVASTTPGVARTIQRLGRMVRADFRYDRSTDVNWEIEWSWKSRGATQQRVTSTRDDNQQSAATALQNAAQGAIVAAQTVIQASNRNLKNSASRFTLGQLEAFALYPQTLVKSITTQLGRIVLAFNDAAQVANLSTTAADQTVGALVDLARDTVDLGNQFRDQLNRTPFEVQSKSDNVADLLRSFRYFAQVDDASQVACRKGEDLQAQFRPTLSTNPGGGAVSSRSLGGSHGRDFLAVRTTRKGDTPQSLSQLYYGTPDREVDILKANRLPWHQVSFDPGTILVIPFLQNTSAI